MTDKQTYWLADQTGKKALVTGAAERDRWVPLGWVEADEPAAGEFVYARHDGIEQPAEFPASAFREVWEPRGWVAGPPPEPVSPFNGDQLPAPASSPTPQPEKAPKSTTSSTAAGGSTKEN